MTKIRIKNIGENWHCCICDSVLKNQLSYRRVFFQDTDDLFLICDRCEVEFESNSQSIKRESFFAFDGDAEVQKTLLNLLEETNKELARIKALCFETQQSNAFDWFKDVIVHLHAKEKSDLEQKIRKYRFDLISLSPAISKPKLFDIERAKEEAKKYSILALLEEAGARFVTPNKCYCVFHDEKTPSMVVYEDARVHCYGCGVNLDTIGFVMKHQDIGFIEALKILSRGNT